MSNVASQEYCVVYVCSLEDCQDCVYRILAVYVFNYVAALAAMLANSQNLQCRPA